MASRSKQIKGITIEIDGNVTKLDRAISGVNKDLATTQSALNDVNRLLKLDPKNTVLLEQKQRLLATAIGDATKKLDILKKGVENVNVNDSAFAEWEKAAKEFDGEIAVVTRELKRLEAEQEKLRDIGFAEDSEPLRDVRKDLQRTQQELETLRRQAAQVYEEMGKPVASDAYDAAQREIVETEQKLRSLQAEAENAGKDVEEFGGSTKGVGRLLSEFDGVLGKVGLSLNALTLAGAIGLAVEAIKVFSQFTAGAVKESAALADEILTLSQQSGLSPELVQGLKLTAEQVDVSAETSIAALEKFRNNLDSNSAATQAAFQALGLSSSELIASGMSMDDMFRLILERLGAIDDEMTRDLLSYDLFGKKADELAGILDDGGAKLFGLIDGYKDLGYVLTGRELDALGQVDDQFHRLNNSMALAKQQIAIELAPEIVALTEDIIALIEAADWEAIGRAATATLKVIHDYILPIIVGLAALLELLFKIIDVIAEVAKGVKRLFTGDYSPKPNNIGGGGTFLGGGTPKPNKTGSGGTSPGGVQGYASGGVFAPNSPMLIGVGDNRQEREVLAPESVIRGVVREELAGAKIGGGSPTFRIVFQGTPDALGRALNPIILADSERVGEVL